MEFKQRTLSQIANFIGGGRPGDTEPLYFRYRSSSFITEFFQDADTDFVHNSSASRIPWIADTLTQILAEPHPSPSVPPDSFQRVIRVLMDQGDAENEDSGRINALALLNAALSREGFEAFYSTDKQCYLRHIGTNTIATKQNPHRPFSAVEMTKRNQLISYLDKASEDDLIEEVLLPLFRQLGFHRITAAGHKDKSLEYGKDVWMKYTLPTQNVIYFGIQAKIGKLDAAGASKGSNANMAEIYQQVLMMIGHEVFDPEISKKVLVDHAFIVAGGEITKAARNWLAGKLDATKRNQIMFLDRDDILNLFIVNNLPLPIAALPEPVSDFDDEIPF